MILPALRSALARACAWCERRVAYTARVVRPGVTFAPFAEVVMVGILWAAVVIVLVIWLIGLLAGIAGGFIHLLLIIALALLIYNLVTGRRAV